MSWWVTDILQQTNGVIILFSWVFWMILSIILHELGHGITAIWQGDDTPIRSGHMTMDPLVHMGRYSLLIFAVVGIAWGAMPVNPHCFRMGRLGDSLVSLAGPAVNFLLALLTATLLGITLHFSTGSSFSRNIEVFMRIGAMLNCVLLLFNLMPVPPLDGAHILAGLSHAADRFYRKPEVQQYAILVFILIFFTGGNLLFSTSTNITEWWAQSINTVLP